MKILSGDVRETLKQVPDGTVQCCVTSPPYWGLRSYLKDGHVDKHMEIGSEKTPEAYVQTMVEVFREVKRCLHESGTCWINLGDGYSSGGRKSYDPSLISETSGLQNNSAGLERKTPDWAKPKDLLMIPWRVALALQADGWWLRSVICWHKKSCMPESVTDRPTNSWEPIFLMAKNAKYFYDAEAVRENTDAEPQTVARKDAFAKQGQVGSHLTGAEFISYTGRNQRNVWTLGPEPYSEAHFATFPTEIPRRAILAGTSASGCCQKCRTPWVRKTEKAKADVTNPRPFSKPGNEKDRNDVGRIYEETTTRTIGWEPGCKCGVDRIPCTVLDPFGGSGTVGQVAKELGRDFILCELNKEYVSLIEKRVNVTSGFPFL